MFAVRETPPGGDRHVGPEQVFGLQGILQWYHHKILIVEAVVMDPENVGPVSQPPHQPPKSGHPGHRYLRVTVMAVIDRYVPFVVSPVGVAGLAHPQRCRQADVDGG